MKLKRKNGTNNMKTIIVKSRKEYLEIPKDYTGKVYIPSEFVPSKLEWYKDGKLHRIDGPACEWEDGDREWYIEGKLVCGPTTFQEMEQESLVLLKTESKYEDFYYAEVLTETGIEQFFVKKGNPKPIIKPSEEHTKIALEKLSKLCQKKL